MSKMKVMIEKIQKAQRKSQQVQRKRESTCSMWAHHAQSVDFVLYAQKIESEWGHIESAQRGAVLTGFLMGTPAEEVVMALTVAALDAI